MFLFVDNPFKDFFLHNEWKELMESERNISVVNSLYSFVHFARGE